MIQVVNDSDELVAHKNRDSLDYGKDIYRVAALWVTNSSGEVLLAQRKLTKDKDPGKWGPAVAGTLDEGETYESNIYKEAEEEIGLKNVEFELAPKMRVYEPRNYFCQWFTVTINRPASSFHPQEEEVEKVEWVPLQRFLNDLEEKPGKYIPTMQLAVETLGIAQNNNKGEG